MNEFEPLEMPEETDTGFWVITVQSEEYRQLFRDIKVREGVFWGDEDNWTTANFRTEEEALFTARIYYKRYGFNYDTGEVVVGSQVMRFK